MKIKRIGTVLVLFAAAGVIEAQSTDSTLDEVIVTATRVAERQSEVPSSVTVITGSEMEARGATTVAQAIEMTASVRVNDHGAAGSQQTATIRGSTQNQVLVLVDGVRVSGASSGYVDLSTIPADSIERIEVLRSGASALYGSDAIGGVINIITKKKAAPLTISVENGSFLPGVDGSDSTSLVDSQKLSFSVAPYIGSVGLRASGGFTRAANAYTFIDTRSNSSSDAAVLQQNAGLLSGNAALGMSIPMLGGTLATDLTGTYQQNGVPGLVGYSSYPNLLAAQTDSRATAVVKFSTDRFLVDALTLEATAHAEYADVGLSDPTSSANTSDSQLLTAGVELQQKAVTSDALTLLYGISSAFDQGLSTKDGTPQRLSVGAFVAPEIDLDSFSIHPTVRYDFYSDYMPGALSGSLGVSWALTDADSLKANISRSYRVPSFDNLYWPSGGQSFAGNPNLTPETGYSLDVGYERSSSGVSYTAFAFARYVQDAIIFEKGSDNIYRPTNLGAAFYPGVEQELKLDFLEHYSVSVGYTFLYSYVLNDGMTLADDKRMPMTPVHTLNATFGYDDGDWSWSVTGRYLSVSYPTVDNSTYLPEAFVLDAIVKKTLSKQWAAYLAVDNLFNEQYQIVSGYPMPGTELRAGITAKL